MIKARLQFRCDHCQEESTVDISCPQMNQHRFEALVLGGARNPGCTEACKTCSQGMLRFTGTWSIDTR